MISKRIIAPLLFLGSTVITLILAGVVCAIVMPSTIVEHDILGRKLQDSSIQYQPAGKSFEFKPNQTGFHRVQGLFDFQFAVDAHGNRVHKGVSPRPKERILVLGDSQTFGFGLQDDETFPYLLQSELKQSGRSVEVINGGVPGFTTFDALEKLKRIGAELKPTLILVVFFGWERLDLDWGNDLYGNWAEKRDLGPPPKSKSAILTKSSHFYSALSTVYRRVTRRAPAYADRIAFYRDEKKGELASAWNKTFTLLRDIQAIAKGLGSKVAVVYLPNVESIQIADDSARGELEKSGLPVVSLFPALSRAWDGNNDNIIFTDGHFNAKASRIIASEIASSVKDRF